jgi:Domain of unknown function (DUF6265)
MVLHSARISLALTLVVALPATAQTAERLGWMAGCWELRTPTRVVEEYWMRPRGGTMLGMGRTVVRDSMTEHESTVIRQTNGRLVYDANPSGQAPTTFPAIIVTGDSVVFEAPEHDFPQRVGYARRGADSLLAWIEGTANGKTRRIPFPYKRVGCPT